MSDDQYSRSVRRALELMVDSTPEGPGWPDVSTVQLRQDPTRRNPVVIVGLAMAGALVAVGGVLLLLNPTGPEPDTSVAPAITATTETTETSTAATGNGNAASPFLEVNGPEGEYVITHLRATIRGTVDPGSEVTVGGVPVAVGEAGTGDSRSGTFETSVWLELGENFLPVTATGPGGTVTWTLRPTVLPSARSTLGSITDATADALEFDPVAVADSDEPTALVKPPALTMLSQDDNSANYTISDSSATVESLRLDPRVSVILASSDTEGSTDTVVPFSFWLSMLNGDQDDTTYSNAANPNTLYWVTVHDNVVVQIQQVPRDRVTSEAHPFRADPPIHTAGFPLMIASVEAPIGFISPVSAVTILNRSDEEVSLNGWSIEDEVAPTGSFLLPDITIGPGQRLTLTHTSESNEACNTPDVQLYWCSPDDDGDGYVTLAWDEDRDAALLIAPDGSLASAFPYVTTQYRLLSDGS